MQVGGAARDDLHQQLGEIDVHARPSTDRPSAISAVQSADLQGLDEGSTLTAADHAGDLGDRGAALADLLETVVAQTPHPLS